MPPSVPSCENRVNAILRKPAECYSQKTSSEQIKNHTIKIAQN